MDLFALITACAIAANPAVNATLYKIAAVHDGHPWAIENSQTGDVYIPDTVEQAYGIATALIESGYTVRLGLVQIDGNTATDVYGLKVEQIFDACTNVSVGSDMLDESWKGAISEREALIGYAGGNTPLTHSWVQDVLNQPAYVPGEKFVGRTYSGPTVNRLFIQTEPKQSYRSPREDVERTIFVHAERRPEKWERPVADAAGLKQQNPLLRNPTPQKRRTGMVVESDSDRKAQPPVTTEKLLTTKGLMRSRGGNDE